MDKRELLTRLVEFYSLKEVTDGFPSQDSCVSWANNVAPLLKFNEQYYSNFMLNANIINNNVSTHTAGPAFRKMRSQVEMAIKELNLELENDHEGQDEEEEVIPKSLELPSTVTLSWLTTHVPVRYWVIFFGFLISIFVFGGVVGRTTFVKELVGSKESAESVTRPAITPINEVGEQIKEITKSHNDNVAKIQAAIIKEEMLGADKNLGYSNNRDHQEAANRLRLMLTEENESFRRNINALRGMKKQP